MITVEWIIGSKYYYLEYANGYFDDFNIAQLVDMDFCDYKDFMENNFNAFIDNNEVLFRNRQDACNALDWIDSKIIMNKLVKSNGKC